MHHDQDIRNMGGLRKYMPITWITSLIGSLALIGTPFFSGFYSKDSVILAVEHSNLPGMRYAQLALLAGVFVTAFYSFRMYFLVFHGKERFRHKPFPGEHDHADEHGHAHVHVPHESPAVVWAPLVALAIPSVIIGFFAIGSMLGGDFFQGAIFVNAEKHPAMEHVAEHAAHAVEMGLHSILTPPFWLALAGFLAAWWMYYMRPELPARIDSKLQPLRKLLENKYYFDWFNENVLARVSRGLGMTLWTAGDKWIIDGAAVNGSAYTVNWISSIVRRVQTGFLYTYAFWMVIGLAVLLGWFLVRAS
jgi:NADH-quinone oxidoreductase subunit L